MRAVETEWWILELPSEWEAEQEDDAVVIADEDGVGEIVISTLQKESGSVSDTELREYASEVAAQFGPGESASIAEARGLYFGFIDGDEAVREWYLRYNDILLLITYCCDADNAGMDDGVVDEILSTLFFKAASDAPSS